MENLPVNANHGGSFVDSMYLPVCQKSPGYITALMLVSKKLGELRKNANPSLYQYKWQKFNKKNGKRSLGYQLSMNIEYVTG